MKYWTRSAFGFFARLPVSLVLSRRRDSPLSRLIGSSGLVVPTHVIPTNQLDIHNSYSFQEADTQWFSIIICMREFLLDKAQITTRTKCVPMAHISLFPESFHLAAVAVHCSCDFNSAVRLIHFDGVDLRRRKSHLQSCE